MCTREGKNNGIVLRRRQIWATFMTRSTHPRARPPPIFPKLAPVLQLQGDQASGGKAKVVLLPPEQPPEKEALETGGLCKK